MKRLIRDFRLIPVVLVAISALFVLKSFGIVFEGGYTLNDLWRGVEDGDVTGSVPTGGDAPLPAPATPDATGAPVAPPPRQRSWAQQMFNFPEVTGSVPTSSAKQESDPKAPKAKSKGQPPPAAGTRVPLDGGRVLSPAERAVLERLSERRTELEARAKELDMRESLVLAAEKRLDARLAELKKLEAQIKEAVRAKDENEAARFKNVITMYENMKPKDAARVFERLEMRVLVEVATKLNPRRMSDIMAQMSSDAAERLTVELASRAKDRPPAELPKIEGRPTASN